jgi:hypothetical protein
MVDAHLTKFIFDHRNPETVVFPENAIQKRGFPGPKEAGQNSDRYARHPASKQENKKV